MSRRNGPKLDLKLNLSPPRVNPLVVESPRRSATVSPTSPQSSCVSSEINQDDNDNLRYSSSPEATSMVLVGCPRCLMYVMLSEDEPKCPKCKSSVLLDFLHENSSPTEYQSQPQCLPNRNTWTFLGIIYEDEIVYYLTSFCQKSMTFCVGQIECSGSEVMEPPCYFLQRDQYGLRNSKALDWAC